MIVTPDPTHPSGINSAPEPSELADGKTVLFLTAGMLAGARMVTDGTVYDITGPVIMVKPEHVRELQLATHQALLTAGITTNPLPSE
jgi:hypothetical protein